MFASAERFDAATGSWSSAGAMSTPRYKHTATPLQDGRVLVVGGSDRNSSCSCTTFQGSAEIYDPATNSWSATASLQTARFSHTATLLNNGKILVTGGFGGTADPFNTGGGTLDTVEIYDPVAGTWTPGADMSVARREHTATLLSDGRVLVTGGAGGSALSSAEIYDPVGDSWSPVTSMAAARQDHSAVALSGHRVLVIGGFNGASSAVFGVESGAIYDVAGNSWTTFPLVVPRQHFTVEALSNDRVMIVGGTPNYPGLPEFFQ